MVIRWGLVCRAGHQANAHQRASGRSYGLKFTLYEDEPEKWAGIALIVGANGPPLLADNYEAKRGGKITV